MLHHSSGTAAVNAVRSQAPKSITEVPATLKNPIQDCRLAGWLALFQS